MLQTLKLCVCVNLIGLAAGLALPTTTQAAPQKGAIAGIVQTPEGAPVVGAIVQIFFDDGGFIDTVAERVTNRRGEFKVRGLAPGSYTVRASILTVDPIGGCSGTAQVTVQAGQTTNVIITCFPVA